MYYDIIIIGSGISGLYAAYNIQKMSPSISLDVTPKNGSVVCNIDYSCASSESLWGYNRG